VRTRPAIEANLAAAGNCYRQRCGGATSRRAIANHFGLSAPAMPASR
jgi:hypothetical protein